MDFPRNGMFYLALNWVYLTYISKIDNIVLPIERNV